MKALKPRGHHGDAGSATRQIEFPLSVPICAWCRPGFGKGDLTSTHGICLRHLRQMRFDLFKQAQKAGRPVSLAQLLPAN